MSDSDGEKKKADAPPKRKKPAPKDDSSTSSSSSAEEKPKKPENAEKHHKSSEEKASEPAKDTDKAEPKKPKRNKSASKLDEPKDDKPKDDKPKDDKPKEDKPKDDEHDDSGKKPSSDGDKPPKRKKKATATAGSEATANSGTDDTKSHKSKHSEEGTSSEKPKKKKRTASQSESAADSDAKEKLGKSRSGKEKLGASRSGDKLRRSDLKRSWAEDELEEIIVDDSASNSDHSDKPASGGDGNEGDFAAVPDEVILNVYRYLAEKEIGVASKVCNRWNKLSFDPDMWAEKSTSWFYIPKAQLNPGQAEDPKNFYVTKYKEQLTREKNQRDIDERRRRDQKKQDAAHKCKWFMRIFFFNRCADYITIVSLILTTIFAVLKLDGAIDWSWRALLTPIYIPMFQLALAIPTFDLGRRMFESHQISEKPGGMPHIVWQFLFCRFRKYRGILYSAIVCGLLFFILLMIKLNDNLDGLPTGVVLIPLLTLAIIVFQSPFTGCFNGSFRRGDHKLDRLIIALTTVFPFLTFLFLSLKLDGVVMWDWDVILIPLWILMCLIVMLPFCMLCTSCCCRSWCEDVSRPMNDRWVFFLVLGLCWVFLLVPFATWFALTSLNLDGEAPDRPWRLIFIPIFLIEGLLFGACVIGDIIVLCCD